MSARAASCAAGRTVEYGAAANFTSLSNVMPGAVLLVVRVRVAFGPHPAAEALHVADLVRPVEHREEGEQALAADLHPWAGDVAAVEAVVLAAVDRVDSAVVHDRDEVGDLLIARVVEHRYLGMSCRLAGQAVYAGMRARLLRL